MIIAFWSGVAAGGKETKKLLPAVQQDLQGNTNRLAIDGLLTITEQQHTCKEPSAKGIREL